MFKFEMISIHKATIGIAAGVAGALFIGYCFYFDKTRRSDPEYKKKIRERRNRIQKSSTTGVENDIPTEEMIDDELERFFRQNIELGEIHIAHGDLQNGLKHLITAMLVLREPQPLLMLLHDMLPPEAVDMLIMMIEQLNQQMENQGANPAATTASLGLGRVLRNALEEAFSDVD